MNQAFFKINFINFIILMCFEINHKNIKKIIFNLSLMATSILHQFIIDVINPKQFFDH